MKPIAERCTDTPDLFGALPPRRHGRHWRPAKGHARPPGSGPAGETCRTCAHYCVIARSKSYRKCGLMRHAWTSSRGTDIRAGDPACSLWAPRPKDDAP